MLIITPEMPDSEYPDPHDNDDTCADHYWTVCACLR